MSRGWFGSFVIEVLIDFVLFVYLLRFKEEKR